MKSRILQPRDRITIARTASLSSPRLDRPARRLSGRLAEMAHGGEGCRRVSCLVRRDRRALPGPQPITSSHSVSDAQGLALVQLQGQFLGEHDVAHGKTTAWRETPLAGKASVLPELFDVHRKTVANAIPFTRRSSHDVEILVLLILTTLGRREVLLQQPNGTLFEVTTQSSSN